VGQGPHSVLILGAGGFLGGHIAREWLMAGASVRAVTRAPKRVVPSGVEDWVGDIRQSGFLEEALDGVDCVVNAISHVGRDTSGLGALLVQKCAHAGVDSLVHLSSIAVLPRAAGVLDDGTRPAPMSAYGREKLAAEIRIMGAPEAGAVRVVILRLPSVFGEGMRGRPLRLARWVRRGLPVPAVGGLRSMLYVRNAARAARLAVTLAGTFVVDEGFVADPAGFAERIGAALGRPARIIRLNARIRAEVENWARRLLTGPQTWPVPRRLAAEFMPLVVDGSRFTEAADFRPPYAPEEAFALTARWLAAGEGTAR
jgi:nucleoside-diphosphate-sugar epimerase